MKGTLGSLGAGLVVMLMAIVGFASTAATGAVPNCRYNSPYVCKAVGEKACGKVGIWTEGVRAKTRVFAKRVSCRTARQVIRRGSSGKPNGRWKSVIGSGEGSVYVKGGSKYRGPKLRWKRYVRSSNVLRRGNTAGGSGSAV